NSVRSAGLMTPLAADKAVAVQQKIIDQQDGVNELIRTRIKLEEDSLRKKLDELSIEKQVATLKRIQTDASRDAADSSRAWRFGETDSDKNATQARLAIQRANTGMFLAADNVFPGSKTDSLSARAKFAGQVLQDEATARRDLQSMETRN
ncbi:MAG: hypothetical protein WCJ66_18935, partial [Verrucomicrobiota bacterium]